MIQDWPPSMNRILDTDIKFDIRSVVNMELNIEADWRIECESVV